jgi:hypothetical protein
MAENLQKDLEQKEPFSPLQTGCAFVMPTNMLIYRLAACRAIKSYVNSDLNF